MGEGEERGDGGKEKKDRMRKRGAKNTDKF